jgi:hypothetical protein
MANRQQQIQIHDILEDGSIIDIMPITTSLDVQVGNKSNGSLTLPGSDASEVLSETLSNIRKYLYNMEYVASTRREISSSKTDSSTINIPTTEVTTTLSNDIDAIDKRVGTLESTMEKGVAPTDHASTYTTYGIGTVSNYGHVKLSDSYKSKVNYGAANNGVASSQNALYNTYNDLNTTKAPTSHASADTTYGIGNENTYGHIKLSDDYTSSAGTASSGVGASSKAVYNLYNLIITNQSSSNSGISGKAPIYHASEDDDYGVGTSTEYGHLKLSDEYNDSSATASSGIAASNYALYRCYANLNSVYSGHINTTATSSKYSHVKLSDNYSLNSGGADSAVGASSKALYDAYISLGTTISNMVNTRIPLSGSDSITGDLKFAESGTTIRGISGRVGTNDAWRVVGGATGENGGYLEIATTDDGNEPIYVRQYKDGDGGGFTKNIIARTATLLDASGNTSFPGTISEGGTSLENKYAPYNHAIGSNSYGGATSTNYGHVKLTDDISDTDASYSIAVSPAALRRSICADGAGAHNAIYRGKYLGDTYTPAQQNAISDGTFDDLFIGDYWTKTSTVNGTSYTNTYIIAGFDYWKRPKPDNTNPTATNVRYRHHCIIVPEKIMYIEKMNSKVTNSGGYLSSSMYSSGLKLAINIAYAVFGESQIGSLSRYVSSDINSSGVITKASVDYNAEISLMDSTMLFGIPIFVGSTKSTLYDPCPQFPLFRYNPEYINCTDNYWLTDIFLENSYGVATSIGRVTTYSPTANNGVRPYITII